MGTSGAADLVSFKEGMGAHPVEHPVLMLEHVPITATEALVRGGLRVAATRAAQARRALAGARTT
jgi:hypothetical protein